MAEKFSGRSLTFRAFVKEQKPVEWIVEGLLPAVGSTIMVGPAGIGKTTLMLQIAAAIYDGTPFMGRKVQQRRVEYVQLDSEDEEWRAIIQRVASDSLARTTVDAPQFCLDNPRYVLALKNLVHESQPGLIVWDSLYKLSERGVNGETVQQTIRTLGDISTIKSSHDGSMYKAPYVVIHHPPQDGTMRASGHNSIEGTFSNVWFLTHTKLLIKKGRLVEEREILMSREKKTPGLWYPSKDVRKDEEGLDDYIRNNPLR